MIDFHTYRQQTVALFNPDALAAARAHARAEWPKESCGLIVNGSYLPCVNRAADPTKDFFISSDAWVAAAASGTITAVIHSHPDGTLYPTADDMRGQRDTAVPWIIIPLNEDMILDITAWGDGLPVAPLTGRPFIHGIYDCYSLVRDYYITEHALTLPDVPRDDGWWATGEDLYMANLTKAGFYQIDRTEIQAGDAFLMRYGDRTGNPKSRINHAGVFWSTDQILHHKPTRLSMREPAGIWARAADIWVRHPEVNGV